MLNLVLYQPEIPPNTGNLIRLSANMGATLHLIHPLGFQLNEKTVRRAGLDYHEWSVVHEYQDYADFITRAAPARLFACTTKATQYYHEANYQEDDYFIFGPETRGLPAELLATFADDRKIKIPMQAHSRSLNLANAVAIIAYEAWRQLGFKP